MPLILAFDSSTQTCSVALQRDGRTLAQSSLVRASGFGGHSEHVLELVSVVMLEAGCSLSGLDAIAFGAGPGAFTGLRVACAVAQGLGLGLGIPLMPVDCLSAIGFTAACQHRATSGSIGIPLRILVIQDARMGEVYLELLEDNGERIQVLEGPLLMSAGAGLPSTAADLVCGNGIALLDASRIGAEMLHGLEAPEASAIAALGARLFAAGQVTDASHASPLYIRDRVALTIAERAAGVRLSA